MAIEATKAVVTAIAPIAIVSAIASTICAVNALTAMIIASTAAINPLHSFAVLWPNLAAELQASASASFSNPSNKGHSNGNITTATSMHATAIATGTRCHVLCAGTYLLVPLIAAGPAAKLQVPATIRYIFATGSM